MWNPFGKIGKLGLYRKLGTVSNLGIDIGTSTIKVLQLSANAEGDNIHLQTYGQLASYGHIRRFNDAIQTEGFRFFENHVVRLLDTVLERSSVTTNDVVFSIPIFSTFITTIRLPYMEPEEMETAIPLQARQYVPSPLEEVQLTWLVVGEESGDGEPSLNGKNGDSLGLSFKEDKREKEGASPRYIRILLIAAPKDVIQQYVDVADQLDLNLQAIELESIALARSSVPDSSKTTLLLDIGARSTDVTLVDNGSVQLSHNVDVAGEAMTKVLLRTGKKSFLDAERMKRDHGFTSQEGAVYEEFVSVIDQITREVKRVVREYGDFSSRPIQNIILAGGTSILSGVDTFFKNAFPETVVTIANPWASIDFVKTLRPILKTMGPAYGVAVGLALRQLKTLKSVDFEEGVASSIEESFVDQTTSSNAQKSFTPV